MNQGLSHSEEPYSLPQSYDVLLETMCSRHQKLFFQGVFAISEYVGLGIKMEHYVTDVTPNAYNLRKIRTSKIHFLGLKTSKTY